MKESLLEPDVLCVGHASYDIVFSVPHHPAEDEKIFADYLISCGGGPAANAAVTASRLGFVSAFAGYLGDDLYGDRHFQELAENGVYTGLVVRGSSPTPLSAVLVKPDGKRALVNYKLGTRPLPANSIDFAPIAAKTVLFDGHEPLLSVPLARRCRNERIATVLDAGSLHEGTHSLMAEVDYLVCSEKFASQAAGTIEHALVVLSERAPAVVITLSGKGLRWRKGGEHGSLPAFPVKEVDSTGAGDAFHGAFAAAIASGLDWPAVLRFASAAGALCCTRMGARPGLPTKNEHSALLAKYQSAFDGRTGMQ